MDGVLREALARLAPHRLSGAVTAYVQRTVVMNTADAIDPGVEPVMVGIAAGEWTRFHLKGIDPVMVKRVRYKFKDVDGPCAETDRN